MVLCDRNRRLSECFPRSVSVEPGRRDEAIDRSSGHAFDQVSTGGDARFRLGPRQAEELALASGHESCAHAVRRPGILRLVAMSESVQEHLDALLGPCAKPGCKGRA